MRAFCDSRSPFSQITAREMCTEATEKEQLKLASPTPGLYLYTIEVLIRYIPPVILILGTFGNVLSFIVLTRRPMRSVSTYLYLAVLSVMDTVVLLVGLLNQWIGFLTGVFLMDLTNWLCKLMPVVLCTASDYSVWLIVAVTIERYIAVCHPLKARSMCSTTKAIKAIICIGIALFVLNCHFFFYCQSSTTSPEYYTQYSDLYPI